MLPHFGHFEPRCAPPPPPCELLLRIGTWRAVASAGASALAVRLGVPNRRAHVARRRELALMLRMMVCASTRTCSSFFVWPVLFNAGTWLHEVLRGPSYRLVDTFAVFDGVWARSDSSHVGSEHLLKVMTSAFIHAARACVNVRTAR